MLDLRAALLETRYIDYQFGERNLDGREQAHAPQYQYDLGVEYHGASGLFARVDFAGLDDFYFDASHDERAPSRVLTHLKAGYSGNHWRAEVWVRNLFDRYYSQRGFQFRSRAAGFRTDSLRAGGRSAPCRRDGDVYYFADGEQMNIGVEISLYPLHDDYIPPIRGFIDRLNADGRFKVMTNDMSTQVFGRYEEVMEALTRELRAHVRA